MSFGSSLSVVPNSDMVIEEYEVRLMENLHHNERSLLREISSSGTKATYMKDQVLSNTQACESCRNSIIPGMVAMVIYRGYFIVRRGPENLEASAIMALFEMQLRRVGNAASVKARPRYVE